MKINTNTWKNKKGITLIALVVTIVVLLILAGVSLNAVIGNDGIIARAQEASREEDITETREKIEMELAGQYAIDGEYTNEDVIAAVLEATGKTITACAETVTTDDGNDVYIFDLWSETVSGEKIITRTESYVGYYADINADGTVDGIIYADLAIGGSGTWNDDTWSTYSYSAQSGLKSYYISKTAYEGAFGTKDVLSPMGTGNDRFYVMALSDFTKNSNSKFYWYYNTQGNMSDYASTTSGDFGTGKQNTLNMLTKWNKSYYGNQNEKDIWGVIQNNGTYDIVTSASDSGKWFVASRGEWAAFADSLGINATNYNSSFGLCEYYWTSSQVNESGAYSADFLSGCISAPADANFYATSATMPTTYGLLYYVRLSTTF